MQEQILELREIAYLDNSDVPLRDAKMDELRSRVRFLEEENQRLSATSAARVAGNPCPSTGCGGAMLYSGDGVSSCQTCGFRWSSNV